MTVRSAQTDALLAKARDLASRSQWTEAQQVMDRIKKAGSFGADEEVLLGSILVRIGRLTEAEEHFSNALSQHADHMDALKWLALVKKSQGSPHEAIKLLQKLTELDSTDAEAFNLLGICELAVGQGVRAEAAFRSSLKLLPDEAPSHANLGMALRLQNRGVDALECFRNAVRLQPQQPENHLQLFKQLQQLSRWDEAISTLEEGVRQHPNSYTLTEALAAAYSRVGRTGEAERLFRQIAPLNASAANSYAAWLQEHGRFEDSASEYERSLLAKPVQGVAFRGLAEAKITHVVGKSLLNEALQVARSPELGSAERMQLAFALGKLFEMDGSYQEAMRWFDEANTLAYRRYPACQAYDATWIDREAQLIAKAFPKHRLSRISKRGSADPRPIFVVGMIRSGTTLLDQILSSHPQVVSVGEPAFWTVEADALHAKWLDIEPSGADLLGLAAEYFKAAQVDAREVRSVDKMPLNFRNLGLIHSVFPNSRIVHVRRNPIDTCLSIYSTFFAGGPSFAYSKPNIVNFYGAYLNLMEHWRDVLPKDRFHELHYERLVSEPEAVLRPLLEFLELPWNDACLHPEDNREQIHTPSRWQARQPIYRSSVERWRRYEPWLGEFANLKELKDRRGPETTHARSGRTSAD